MSTTSLILTCVLSVAPAAAFAASSGDKASAKPAAEEKTLSKAEVVALAERFVAEQGYTAQPSKAAKDKIVVEPTEGARTPDEVLKGRQGSLEPKAAGARLDSELWFVGFRAAAGTRIRGVRLDAKGQNIRMLSQNMQADWLLGSEPQAQPLTADEAKAVAARFVAEQAAKGVSKNASRAEDHKPSKQDGWDAWWVYFPKTAGTKDAAGKPAEFAIVSVHKLSRQPKWILPEAKAPPTKSPPKQSPRKPVKKKP